MKPNYDGMDLFNAICNVKSDKYKITTVHNGEAARMTYCVERGRHHVTGEFIFNEEGDKPVSYRIGSLEHKPISDPLSLSKDKLAFIENFITYRLTKI